MAKVFYIAKSMLAKKYMKEILLKIKNKAMEFYIT